jgi:hypothetical protein
MARHWVYDGIKVWRLIGGRTMPSNRHCRANIRLGFLSLLAAWLISAPCSAQPSPSSIPWQTLFNSFDSQYGTRFANSTDSGDLAYGEAYIIESYVVMYEATGNQQYLEEASSQIKTEFQTAEANTDGIGWAWESARVSVEKLLNTDFEDVSADDDTLPADWNRSAGTTSNLAYLTRPGELVVKAPRTGTASVYQALSSYMIRPDLPTTYAVVAKVDGTGTLEVAINGNVVEAQNFSVSTWTNITTTFTAPQTAGQNVVIIVSSQAGQPYETLARFEDVTCSARLPYLAHDGMILHAIAKFIRVVFDDSAAADLQTAARTYLGYIEKQHFDTRWQADFVKQGNAGFYIIPPGWTEAYSSPNDPAGSSIPYNEFLSYGQFLLEMCRITAVDYDCDRATNIAVAFRNALQPNGSGLVWTYEGDLVPADSVRRKLLTENSRHADADIRSVADYAESGIVFSKDYLRKFAYTFVNIMYQPSTATLSTYVNGVEEADDPNGYYNDCSDWPDISSVNSQTLPTVVNLYENPEVTIETMNTYPLLLANMELYAH